MELLAEIIGVICMVIGFCIMALLASLYVLETWVRMHDGKEDPTTVVNREFDKITDPYK